MARSCGKCSLCCKLNKIAALDKPSGSWCVHCKKGAGCGIYADRPEICRQYHCLYLLNPNVPEFWYPLNCHMIIQSGSTPNAMIILVDPDRPQAWRCEPHLSTIRAFAAELCRQGGMVIIKTGARVHIALPDNIVDMGVCTEDDHFQVGVLQTGSGPRWTAAKIAKPV